MKEQKTDKNLKRQKNRPAGKGAAKKLRTGILTAAACAAAVIAVVGLRGLWNRDETDIAGNDTRTEGIPSSQETEDDNLLSVINNMFTLQVQAAELEEGQPVPLVSSDNNSQINGRQAESWVMGGTEEGDIDYCINLPLSCTGNNIEKVTYSVNQGAFQIVQPEGESIIIDGQPYSGGINAGNVGQIGGCYDDETGLAQCPYEIVFYSSFTLDYQKQSDESTWINVCNALSGKAETQQMIWGDSLEEMNRGVQEMLDNTVITCTVQYRDGTTQSADILISSQIMTCAEAGVEAKEDPNQEELFITFELQGE